MSETKVGRYLASKVDANTYTLTGKRGAVYGAVRCMETPHLLRILNLWGIPVALEGNSYCTDRDGTLRYATFGGDYV